MCSHSRQKYKLNVEKSASLRFINKLQHSELWDEIKSIQFMDLLPETLVCLCWRKWDWLLETGHIWAYLNEKYIGFMLVFISVKNHISVCTTNRTQRRCTSGSSTNTKRAVSEKTNQFWVAGLWSRDSLKREPQIIVLFFLFQSVLLSKVNGCFIGSISDLIPTNHSSLRIL